MEKKSLFVQEIATECDIDAPAAKVYSVISDFSGYPKWTKNHSVNGDTRPGGKMCVMVNIPNKGWQKLSSRMKTMNEGIIAFDNVVASSLLFCGKHCYEIIPLSETKTKFINREVFSGLMIPFFRSMLLNGTRQFKQDINAALKRAVE